MKYTETLNLIKRAGDLDWRKRLSGNNTVAQPTAQPAYPAQPRNNRYGGTINGQNVTNYYKPVPAGYQNINGNLVANSTAATSPNPAASPVQQTNTPRAWAASQMPRRRIRGNVVSINMNNGRPSYY